MLDPSSEKNKARTLVWGGEKCLLSDSGSDEREGAGEEGQG